MAIHPYFGGNPPYNELENYQRYVFSHPELSVYFPNREDIDDCDARLVLLTARCFWAVMSSKELRLIWNYAFARIEPREAIPFKGDEPLERANMRESVMMCVKTGVDLFTKDGDMALLRSLQKVCWAARIFSRKPNRSLDFLWEEMSLPEEWHDLQKAPHPDNPGLGSPPPSCWSAPDRWRSQDWSLKYFTGSGHGLTIFRGMVYGASVMGDKERGIVPRRSFAEKLGARDLAGIWSSVQESVSYLYGNTREGEPYCATFPLSERPEDVDPSLEYSLVDYRIPEVIANLIRMGDFYPFTTIDSSFGRGSTAWREGAQSVHYVSALQVASQFSREPIVEALLEDKKSFDLCYQKADFSDTPYMRAVRNEKYPSVLIPFYEEVKRDPDGALAQEIDRWAQAKASSEWLPSCLASAFPGEAWRFFYQNRLILACVSGDLEFAHYIIQEREERIRSLCSEDSTEEEKCLRVAASCSQFVNRPCFSGGPGGSPAEIAIEYKHPQIAQLLCAKGAKVSVEVQMAATGQMIGQINRMTRQWKEAQKEIRRELERGGEQVRLTESLLNELTAAQVAYKNGLQALYAQEKRQADQMKRFQQGLDKFGAILERLERFHRLKNEASKTIIHHFSPTPYKLQEIYVS